MLDEKADNYEQRKERRVFYLKNGYKETNLFLSYQGVDYEVFQKISYKEQRVLVGKAL